MISEIIHILNIYISVITIISDCKGNGFKCYSVFLKLV